MRPGVTVCIPTIPVRGGMLSRAMNSAAAQTRPVDAISVAIDTQREGAAVTRDRAWRGTGTEWVAFLDDDDALYPEHVERLLATAQATDAGLVYPWYDVDGGIDPFPQWEGVEWRNDEPHQVPITFLVRHDVLRELGGFTHEWDPTLAEDPGVDADGNRAGEDYRFILRAVRAGVEIVHLPVRTWRWYHHGKNTMGLPSRW